MLSGVLEEARNTQVLTGSTKKCHYSGITVECLIHMLENAFPSLVCILGTILLEKSPLFLGISDVEDI